MDEVVTKIVECVPNFSQGRRPEVIEAIVGTIQTAPGVHVLDAHSDPDHNRTVVTFVGAPKAVQEAAFRAIRKAAELIDMDQHQGEHPRLGATDVVPFVPVSGVTMAECVALARRLGERVGEALDIPVYLYEAAATRPDRVNLADVRRGEYERLKVEIETDPERAPDFGPSRLGPAGATVIGARPFLVAFNVYLNTDDVDIAAKIARAVRHSSGGLRYVKALGLLVEGRAQVSMNLTDFTKTPIHRVVELIRREAARYGVAVTDSEVVGLVPQAALVNAAQWYLQVAGLDAQQILENKLASLLQAQEGPLLQAQEGPLLQAQEGPLLQAQEEPADITPTDYLDAVASKAPTPGGGSVAALAGALAAALALMVGRLTLGKTQYAEVERELQSLVEQGERLRAGLTDAIARDSQAFEGVMAAYRLPRETATDKAARQEAIQEATRQAALVPLQVARDALEGLRLAALAARHGNLNAITDAGSAALMAQAAIGMAGLNVQINAQSLTDQATVRDWLDELDGIRVEAQALSKEIEKSLAERAEIKLDS